MPEKGRVRGVGARRYLTDLVSLVRHAVQPEGELVPYPDEVRQRYADWLKAQQVEGRAFTQEQRWWLDRIAEHIGVNLAINPVDFDYGEFFNKGGRIKAIKLFGPDLTKLLEELNSALVA